jgi:serine protease Do
MKRTLLPYLAALYSMLGVTAQAQKVTDPINDCAFFAALAEQGGQLMEDGKGISAETLRGQLVRTHCDLKLSSTPATKPMTAAEIYAAACDSVIVVSGVAKFGKDPKWQANPATAFPIGEPDVFVTNYHVFNETKSLGFVGMTRQGKIQPVTEILAASRVNDTVIFRAPGLGRRPLTLRDDAPAVTPVAVIGHPDGHFYSLSQGTIARHALAHYAGLASAGHRLEGLMPLTPNSESRFEMDITADYAGGASGAPILDDCGNVVGLAATTLSRTPKIGPGVKL